jgi:hypothetical protein
MHSLGIEMAALSELYAQESSIRPDKARVCRVDLLIRKYEPSLVTAPDLGLIMYFTGIITK